MEMIPSYHNIGQEDVLRVSIREKCVQLLLAYQEYKLPF